MIHLCTRNLIQFSIVIVVGRLLWIGSSGGRLTCAKDGRRRRQYTAIYGNIRSFWSFGVSSPVRTLYTYSITQLLNYSITQLLNYSRDFGIRTSQPHVVQCQLAGETLQFLVLYIAGSGP